MEIQIIVFGVLQFSRHNVLLHVNFLIKVLLQIMDPQRTSAETHGSWHLKTIAKCTKD